jgi:hypothetical protein
MPGRKEKQPLSVTHPELAKEADGWDPATIHYSSKNVVSWKCKLEHRWLAKPVNRAGNGRNVKTIGCPVCTGSLPEKGISDLAALYPHLANEADGWDPSEFFPGSNRAMLWRCKLGHTWSAVIYERAKRNSGCPYCMNTRVLPGFNDLQTLFPSIASQAAGWDPTRVNPGSHKKYAWNCEKGHTWISTPVHRSRMKQNCAVCDGKQIEFGFNDLFSKFPEISKQADGWDPKKFTFGSHQKKPWRCKSGHTWNASIGDMTSRNSLCPFCSNHNFLSGLNDLKTLFPDIAKEADGWDPSQTHSGTSATKSWICKLGHRWRATLNSRTALNAGCPYCSGAKVWPGFNDLVTTNSEFAFQALGWDPSKFSAGSALKKKWKCGEGHTWVTAINVRTKSGCPTCATSGFDPNKPSYLYFLEQEDWRMFQIGITNDIDRRIEEHARNGWDLIEFRGPMDGLLTQQWETAILRMLKAKGADLSNSKIAGKFDGYSEAWSKSTFEVKSIKELMKLTEEFEEQNGKK